MPSRSPEKPTKVGREPWEVPTTELGASVAWPDFLTAHPPSSLRIVHDCLRVKPNAGSLLGLGSRPSPPRFTLSTPPLRLHCELCRQDLQFDPDPSAADGVLEPGREYFVYLRYTCRNCRKHSLDLPLRIWVLANAGCDERFPETRVVKIGQWPPFGQRLPSNLQSLTDPHDLFLHRGRRCEAQSLGIGAFAYYRRIVEDGWSRLLDKVEAVWKREFPDSPNPAFATARAERRFSAAVTSLRDVIPPSLKIHGANPFLLLHSATSADLHSATDEDCLRRAADIREVLVEFAERLQQLARDDAKLREAVTRLREGTTEGKASSTESES